MKIRLTILAALTVAGGLAGCATDVDGDLRSANQDLSYVAGKRWPKKNIEICFVAPSGMEQQKDWVQVALKGQKSWEHVGNVTFTGFEDCSNDEPFDTLVIWLFSDGAGAQSNFGYQDQDSPTLNRIMMTAGDNLEDTYLACSEHDPPLGPQDCLKMAALHEVGHSLAIVHENTRSNTPSSCPDADGGTVGDTQASLFDTSSIMVEGGGACSAGRNLSARDMLGFDRMYGPREGDDHRLGDFDGDGRADLLCHDAIYGERRTRTTSGQYWGDSWSQGNAFCEGDTEKLFKGDFDGNGRTDLLCHDTVTGRKKIDYASSSGQLNGTNYQNHENWCTHNDGHLFVGDFNGDGRDDLMCHDVKTGYKWFAYAQNGVGRFSFAGSSSTWSWNTNWCAHTEGRIFIGDFDGDDHDDLMCHDISTGNKWIYYAENDGRFVNDTFYTGADLCSGWDQQVRIGDFDGDGSDDLLCHNAYNGRRFIDYAADGFGAWDSSETDTSWCQGDEKRLHVGDVNNDDRDDLICHHIRTGYKWVDFANTSGELGGENAISQDMKWCNMDRKYMR